jgi:DNA-binding transcriptional ArsR family regulator
MLVQFHPPKLAPIAASAAAEPIRNALISLSLLHRIELQEDGMLAHVLSEHATELGNWIVSTAQQISPAELQTNRLLFEVFGGVLLMDLSQPDFPAYLAALAAHEPIAFREATLGGDASQNEQLIANQSAYLEYMAAARRHDPIDPELLREAHALFADPAALQHLVVEHLQHIWNDSLAAEWRKRSKLIQVLADGLQQRGIPASDAPSAIRAVIGRDLPIELATQLGQIKRIVFVPALHIGLYTSQFERSDTLWVFVAVSTLTSWALRQGPIKTSEVLGRIAPLADETGLRILDLIATKGEVSAQDLIASLGISQSGVSRHIKALGSYVAERRGEGASKYYQINYRHLDWTVITLRRFLGSEHRQSEVADRTDDRRGIVPALGQKLGPQRAGPTVDAPADLRRFMDARGLLTAFPTRRRDQDAVLQFLIGKFQIGQFYSEREVNELISAALSPSNSDFVTLRRELFDAGLLGRERDGSRYWRTERPSADIQP